MAGAAGIFLGTMSSIVVDLLAHASRLPIAVLPQAVGIEETQVWSVVADSIVEDVCDGSLQPFLSCQHHHCQCDAP